MATVTNIGDGNLSGLGAASNLSAGTTARTLVTGWTGTASNTAALTDGASASAGTYTYTARSSRATTTMTVTSSFTNGNPNNTNSAAVVTTTLTGVTVAPVQSVTSGPSAIFALPGATGSSTLTIKNTGDGNLAGSGSTFNLNGASTAAGTGFAVNSSSAFSLTDDSKGVLSTSSTTQTVTYAGTTRGATSNGTITTAFTNGNSAGTNAPQTVTKAFTGQTVAPVASVASTLSFTPVTPIRVGTTAALNLTVKNTGDGNLAGADNGTSLLTNLRGSVASSAGTFQGSGGAVNLTDTTGGQSAANASQTYSFTYAPTARGASSQTITTTLTNGANSANAGGTATTTLTGTAVGPQYGAAVTGTNQSSGTIINGGTILFGDFVNGLMSQNLLVSNLSNDLAASKGLTDLSLTSISISGSNDFSFSLSGFNSNGASSGVISTSQYAGIAGNIQIQFATKASVQTQAYLTIATDEGAGLGGAGAIYVYNLIYTVPEPGTLMVLGVGMLGLAISRRNRRGKPEAVRLTAAPLGEDDRTA